MSLRRGYERYLGSSNPKLGMNQVEYTNCKANPNAYLNSVEEELVKDEARLIKMTRSGRHGLIAFGFFLGGISMLLSSFVRRDDQILRIATISVAGLLIISGFTSVGTAMKKAKNAPSNLEELRAMVKAYHEFHIRHIRKSNNYDEYRHYLTMANVGDFQEIFDQTGNSQI